MQSSMRNGEEKKNLQNKIKASARELNQKLMSLKPNESKL